jgi:hypothetical protein
MTANNLLAIAAAAMTARIVNFRRDFMFWTVSAEAWGSGYATAMLLREYTIKGGNQSIQG